MLRIMRKMAGGLITILLVIGMASAFLPFAMLIAVVGNALPRGLQVLVGGVQLVGVLSLLVFVVVCLVVGFGDRRSTKKPLRAATKEKSTMFTSREFNPSKFEYPQTRDGFTDLSKAGKSQVVDGLRVVARGTSDGLWGGHWCPPYLLEQAALAASRAFDGKEDLRAAEDAARGCMRYGFDCWVQRA